MFFNNSDILRIYAEPFAFNAASCRVLEKAGFQYEGTLRSNAVKNGKVIDMKMYSLLKSVSLIFGATQADRLERLAEEPHLSSPLSVAMRGKVRTSAAVPGQRPGSG